MAAFAKFVNSGENVSGENTHGFENKFVCLTADIDLQGTAPIVDYQDDGDSTFEFKVVLSGEISNNWIPIGHEMDSGYTENEYKCFKGTFDGKNHRVLGMVSYDNSDYYGGLFGYTKDAIIQNVGVKNSVVITDYGFVGKIAGKATNTTIQNCYASGTIYKSTNYRMTGAGGIIGCAVSAVTVKNCYNSGDIFSFVVDCLGGISSNFFNGNNCFSTGRLYSYTEVSTDSYMGGLTGGSNGNISNSYYDKDVAPGLSAVGNQEDTETVKGLSTAEFEQKLAHLTYENGEPMWFLGDEDLNLKLKTPKSSDFTFSHPKDMAYDGKGKVIKIVPKTGISGMGAVTVKYYKVENGSTTLLAGPPTDAGRYKVKFDVAAGTEYYAATDLPAMF